MNEGLVLAGIALVAANAPFIASRPMLILWGARADKRLAERLLELVVLFGLVLLLAVWLEARRFGGAYPQGWAFYVVTSALFIVAAAPGFAWRYLWHRPAPREARS